MSITVKKRLTDSVISSSRNAAVHIEFNLKYVVSSEITRIYKAKTVNVLDMVLIMIDMSGLRKSSIITP